MINYPPRGLVLDIVTPFDEEGRPDSESMGWLIQRFKRDAGVILAGSLEVGEALNLGREARIEILESVLKTSKKGPALFFEITAVEENDTLEILNSAESLIKDLDLDPELYYFLTPLVYHGNRNLPDHLDRLCRKTGRPFILSNNPRLVKKFAGSLRHENIRTSVLKKISNNEQVVGLALNGGVDRALNYQRALRSRPGFRFYDGNENSFINQPSSSGLISCGANLLPRAWADIVDSSLDIFESKRMYPDHISKIWQNGRMVRRLLNVYKDNPPGFIKTGLKLLDLIPRAQLSDPEKEISSEDELGMKTFLTSLELL